MSEGQTWSSLSSLALGDFRSQIPDYIFWNLRFAICNPAGHVFAAEGLLLAHDFPFNCGIRVQIARIINQATRIGFKNIHIMRKTGDLESESVGGP